MNISIEKVTNEHWEIGFDKDKFAIVKNKDLPGEWLVLAMGTDPLMCIFRSSDFDKCLSMILGD